jgi:hypothetical protein
MRVSSSGVGARVSVTVGAERSIQPVFACTSSSVIPGCNDVSIISPESSKLNTPSEVTTVLGPPPDRPTLCRQPLPVPCPAEVKYCTRSRNLRGSCVIMMTVRRANEAISAAPPLPGKRISGVQLVFKLPKRSTNLARGGDDHDFAGCGSFRHWSLYFVFRVTGCVVQGVSIRNSPHKSVSAFP